MILIVVAILVAFKIGIIAAIAAYSMGNLACAILKRKSKS